MTEIISCPKCRRSLQVPETYLGQTVERPECGHQFTAASNAVSSVPHAASSPAPAAPERKRWADEDPDDNDYHLRRRRNDDDEDDFDPALRVRHNLPPNRGGVIMALGLVSLIGGWMFCLPVVIGPIAWFMAQQDLRAIRDGQMDATNESMVRTGQVCGIISTIILVLGLALVAFFIFAGMGGF